MPDFSAALQHLYRRLLGVPGPGAGEPEAGVEAETTAAAALAVVEAALALGGSLEPSAQPSSPVATPAATQGLARALGLALTGQRGTALLDAEGADLSRLREAAARCLPLVAYHGLAAENGLGGEPRTGHGPWHDAAAAGALTLVAATAQEAVDFGVLGRRVAEDALLPVVVALDPGETARAVSRLHLPSASLLRGFLGRPEDLVHVPNAAQEQLFGRHRRRVPRWHDTARPRAAGGPRGADSFAVAAAARHAYFEPQGEASLRAAAGELGRLSGRRLPLLSQHFLPGAETALVALGSAVVIAEAATDAVSEAGGPRIGVLGIRLLRPFPAAEAAQALAGVGRVVVLERVEAALAEEGPLTLALRAALGRARENEGTAAAPRLRTVLYGLGGQRLRTADLEELCRRLGTEVSASRSRRGASAPWALPRYLGVDFAPDLRADPKRQAALDRLLRDHPKVAGQGLKASTNAPAVAGAERQADLIDAVGLALPAAARRAHGEAGSEDLPAFWDRVVSPAHRGEGDSLVPDPALALGVQPAASAALRGAVAHLSMLPAFDPGPCTGCGECWTVCPEGAVRPAVTAAAGLLELGLRRARAAGASVDALRMVTTKLAAGLADELASEAAGGGPAGHLLAAALEKVLARTQLPPGRREQVEAAFAVLRQELAALPLARTAPFFDAGGGGASGRQILSLAVDPDACTGCGLCVAVCEPGALVAAPPDEGRLAAGRALVDRVAALPEPSATVLEEALRQGELSSLAACLLPAAHRQILSAGCRAEPGSGEALALRQVLGVAAHHLAGENRRWVEELGQLSRELAAAIHQALEGALPDGDLDALALGLDAVGRPETDLADLTRQVEQALKSPRVDVAQLRQLVRAAQELANLRLEAERGLASPFSVVVAAGGLAAWSGGFPYNAFSVAVTFAPAGDLAGLACGLLEGQVEKTLEGLRVLHRGRALVVPTVQGLHPEPDERRLCWADLSAAERRFCPPLVVVAPEAFLAEGDLQGLLGLLGEDLPIKILLLADLDLGLADASRRPYLDGAQAALLRPRATVVQSSIAHPQHLEAGVAAAFQQAGPALLRVHAPSPRRHGFSSDATFRRARAAVTSRTFPLFQREPAPGPALFTTQGPFHLHREAAQEGAFTPAHWALEEERFAAFFSPLGAEDRPAVELAGFLALAAPEREGNVPVVTGPGGNVWKVAAPLAVAVEERLAWNRVLELLAGAAAAATAPTAAAVENRLAALAVDTEHRLASQAAELRAETASRLRQRLLGLMTGSAPVAGQTLPEKRP